MLTHDERFRTAMMSMRMMIVIMVIFFIQTFTDCLESVQKENSPSKFGRRLSVSSREPL